MPYEELVSILKSLRSVKGVKVEIKSEFWGEEYALNAEKPTYKGVIDRWEKSSSKEALYIMWEGYARNQKAPLDKMNTDAAGDSLELKFLPGADGKMPELIQGNPGQASPEDSDDDEEVELPEFETFNDQKWKVEKDPKAVRIDARTQPRFKPQLNGTGTELDSVTKLFYHLLPPTWVADILKYTNPFLDGHDAVHAKLTEGELLRFLGYMLSLSIHSGVAVERMWSKTPLPTSTAPPPMMGRFGMTENRFSKIRAVFRCGPSDDASLDANDWSFVENISDGFNAHMCEQITPGWLLGADESMCAWRGKVGKKDTKKCPHRMFVRRKPEPLGVEFKNIGDALSGIILFQEITKGKAEVVKPKYYSKEVGATAATTLRLSEPWFGSNRVVAGDSWFASVRTAEELGKNGLYFIGDIKTGTKRFVSRDSLNAATARDNGAWATWISELKLGGDVTMPVYAVSHRRGESIHGFVSTCGTTLPGHSHYAYFEDDEERAMGHIEDFELSRNSPRVLNDFTLAQPTIDRHNRYRQHILAMEKRFVTNNFSFRFFTTMYGMLVTNCFFAHRYFNNQLADFKSELDQLALALMRNPKAEAPRPCSQAGGARSPTGSCTGDGDPHYLTPLSSIDGYTGGKQQRCVCCNNKTAWVCATCTTGPMALVPLCPEISKVRKGPSRGQQVMHPCLGRHRCNPTFFPKGKRGGSRPKRARGPAEDPNWEEFGDDDE